MLPPHLHEFTDTELYESYGIGAIKNLWLLTCLVPIARTVNAMAQIGKSTQPQLLKSPKKNIGSLIGAATTRHSLSEAH
jgi:hypothetical protein